MGNINKEQTKNFKVDFIIPGVMKGGTTSAMKNLNKHPKLHLAPKETHFFVKNKFDRGLSWYEDQFKIPKDFTGLVGEKTPRYCVCPGVFDRIKKTFPDVKFVMFLRDPVTRMYSQWNHHRDSRNELPGLPNYITFLEWMLESKKNMSVLQNPYNRGMYAKQLKKIVNKFGRENLYVTISERCKKNPLEEYNKIFNFLGVSELSESEKKYKNIHKRSYVTTMQEKERDYLIEYFKPYNEQLFEFLGYEIEEWS